MKVVYNLLAVVALILMLSATTIPAFLVSFLSIAYLLNKAEVVNIIDEALKEED